MFQECKRAGDTVREDDNWGTWKMSGWEEWKKQFLWIAQDPDEKFDSESRHVAKLTHQQMESYEALEHV